MKWFKNQYNKMSMLMRKNLALDERRLQRLSLLVTKYETIY